MGLVTTEGRDITQFDQIRFGKLRNASIYDGKKAWGGRNTYAVKQELDGETQYGLLYHSTVVIWYRPSLQVAKLDTGGWHTLTTKERMNWALPSGYHIYQRNHDWFLVMPSETVDFWDGMLVDLEDHREIPDYIAKALRIGR